MKGDIAWSHAEQEVTWCSCAATKPAVGRPAVGRPAPASRPPGLRGLLSLRGQWQTCALPIDCCRGCESLCLATSRPVAGHGWRLQWLHCRPLRRHHHHHTTTTTPTTRPPPPPPLRPDWDRPANLENERSSLRSEFERVRAIEVCDRCGPSKAVRFGGGGFGGHSCTPRPREDIASVVSPRGLRAAQRVTAGTD